MGSDGTPTPGSAARTPADHDRVVDLVRAVAILGVVVGHWMVDGFYLRDGEVLERSNLGQVPGMWPLSWVFMVLPLFFFVGGWSNMRSWDSVRGRGLGYGEFLSRRVHRLLTPTLLYVGVLFAVAVLVRLFPGVFAGRFTDQTAVLATQPLWFLGIYLVLIALTPVTLAAHRRWGWGFVLALFAVVVGVDAARFTLGWQVLGVLNVFAVWILVHQFGYFDAQQRIGRDPAWALAVGGYLGLSLLVALGPYPARMVGVTGDEWSNAHPPNLAMLALSLGQIGLVELLRPALGRAMHRPRLWLAVVVVNSVILSLYLWHQVAHMLVAGVVLPLGYPVPTPATPAWWAAMAGMMAMSALVLVGILALVRPAEHRPAPPPIPAQRRRSVLAATGLVLAALGLLALAGTTVTRLAETIAVLGPVRASSLLGLILLGAAVAVFRFCVRPVSPRAAPARTRP